MPDTAGEGQAGPPSMALDARCSSLLPDTRNEKLLGVYASDSVGASRTWQVEAGSNLVCSCGGCRVLQASHPTIQEEVHAELQEAGLAAANGEGPGSLSTGVVTAAESACSHRNQVGAPWEGHIGT